jgi:protein tyrosine phosphatase (PTP) superfamily phosphohydrolase (DUF442 family)
MINISILSKSLAILLLAIIGYYIWYVHFNYRFEEISPNKVYKSALIPPDEIGSFLKNNDIKTVINLLDPRTQDSLNPATQKEIDAEARAIETFNTKYNRTVRHINIPSKQTPSNDKIERFLSVLDDPSAYPVLIHCYHGTGRAELYSAIYRLEYENWSNQDAREQTRVLLSILGYKSSFALGRGKGDFLNNYIIREDKVNRLARVTLSKEETQREIVSIQK